MERPSNRQCKIARLLTGGKASDEQIYREFNSNEVLPKHLHHPNDKHNQEKKPDSSL